MLRVVTSVTIQQLTQIEGKAPRNKVLTFDFVNELSCSDTWRDLTNSGKLIIPKNLYYRDANNKLVPIYGTNVSIGGYGNTLPLFMRGDKITCDYGYRYPKGGKEVLEGTYNAQTGKHLFEGYISKVGSKKPIEIEFEDNMWQLKQIQVPNHSFTSKDSLEDIMRYLLKDTQFTVTAFTTTNFGAFRVGGETVAEVLARLRKQFKFEAYFKGNELRVGISVYKESESQEYTFTFQKDIISDSLEYKRKEDVVLSILAHNSVEEATGKTTKDGKAKTKKSRIEVLLTLQNGSDTPIIFNKTKDNQYPPNTGGERMTLPYVGANTKEELISLATAQIKKYYYSGFKGKFVTFGTPYVKMGDLVTFVDPILPERNGTYRVRGVEYTAGNNGIRQAIELDYKIIL